jgi:predicted nucleic acid-binding protein
MKAKAPLLYVAEPPSAYLARPPIVIDCSVLVAILFEETLRKTAYQLIAGRSLHAPWLLDHEIASVAEKKRRAGVPAAAIEAGIRMYEDYDVTMHRTTPASVVPLTAAYSLSAYDAAYLAVAADLRIPLVTFDRKLGGAASKHLGALE